jgi:penicillin-binding protein 2
MFERRLKIFLFILCLASGALALRAAQLQWWQRDYWQAQASKMMRQSELIETTRGKILDRNGKVLAQDQPCIDACVDYRAITDEPDPAWLQNRAKQNLRNRLGDQFGAVSRSADFKQMLKDEIATVNDDIRQMWVYLAKVQDLSPDQMDDIRRDIVAEVTMRKRYIWWGNYEHAARGAQKDQAPSWYRHFLSDSGVDDDEIDKFTMDVGEQVQPHVILHAITPQQQAMLARQLDRFFALSLVPGKHREYPCRRVACHIIGTIGPVSPEQCGANDPFGSDELRSYKKTDQIGRSGVEALCEQALRGTRGRVERLGGSEQVVSKLEPLPGRDVRLSIDADLQADLENALDQERITTNSDGIPETRQHEHAAAVVIKIATGEVLALASNPGYDLNDLDKNYSTLAEDYINLPLLNRATQMAEQPGSTVKPMVGSGAITSGIITSRDRIPCNGSLIIDGKEQAFGHCWIFDRKNPSAVVSHNLAAGDNALPPEGLTITDGIERSCNVVFETVANKMGMNLLMQWYAQYGLGRPTGIGIEEIPGRLFHPGKDDRKSTAQILSWSAGIGEGVVLTTPLQMANVAATVARGGIWMRPRLVTPQDSYRATTQPAAAPTPDCVDLHLTPEAAAAVQKGMFEVCNDRDGTGRAILPEKQPTPLPNDPLLAIHVAGKTGTAQSSQMTIPQRDPQGNIRRVKVDVGTPGTETWYQDKEHFDHAWFIGYAPYENPQVAFCVFVEYGEAGGRVAGPIAHDVLVACIRHGYLGAPQESTH